MTRDLTRLAHLVMGHPGQDGTGSARDLPGGASDPAWASMGPEEVASALYALWYLAPTDERDVEGPGSFGSGLHPGPISGSAGHPAEPRDDLSGVLRAAHAGSTRYSTGWVVLAALEGGACLVGRDQEQRVVQVGGYVNLHRPGVPVAPGEEAAVMRCIDRVDHATRWWGTRSELGEPVEPLGRHYLHPRLSGATRVVSGITSRLLDADCTWSLKLPIDPSGWRRPDALVVYAPRQQSARIRDVLAAVAAAEAQHLRNWLPPLTQPIGEFISYADDPGGDHSFGSHICAALAPGVRTLASRGQPQVDPLAVLRDSMARSGIDPVRPWLRGSDG